jgi:uncharacterized protein (TIGR02246 family)
MTPVTREAVAELLARYAHAYDAGDVAGAAACFTADGTMTTTPPGGDAPAARGRDELEAFFGAARAARAARGEQPRHLVSNVVVSVADHGASALVKAYMTLVLSDADGVRIDATGVYEDRVVATADGCRFATRHLTFDRPPS